MNTGTAEHYMKQALTLASEGLAMGEFPIGAVVVLDGKVIAQGITSEQREKRFLGHAELIALEEADSLGLSFSERRATRLFTNLEPCLMCMGAAMSFVLGELYFGLESPADGAVNLVKGWARRENDMPGYQLPRISGGLLREESIALFEKYVSLHKAGPMRAWAATLVELRRTPL